MRSITTHKTSPDHMSPHDQSHHFCKQFCASSYFYVKRSLRCILNKGKEELKRHFRLGRFRHSRPSLVGWRLQPERSVGVPQLVEMRIFSTIWVHPFLRKDEEIWRAFVKRVENGKRKPLHSRNVEVIGDIVRRFKVSRILKVQELEIREITSDASSVQTLSNESNLHNEAVSSLKAKL